MGERVVRARTGVKRRRSPSSPGNVEAEANIKERAIERVHREAEGHSPLDREGVFTIPVTAGSRVSVIEQADGRWAILIRQPFMYEVRLLIDNSKLCFNEVNRAFAKAYKLNGTIDQLVSEEVERTLKRERDAARAATPQSRTIVGSKGGPTINAIKKRGRQA